MLGVIQAIAFISILVNGCFLDSVDYMPFIYRILVSVAIYIIAGYFKDPVSIEVEE